MKQSKSYLANSLLAGGVLYWVVHLSSSGTTPIDWTIIVLVVLAILWNRARLGQRLHSANGDRGLWRLGRTILFWIIGVFNTVLIRPEDVGSWKHAVGYAVLILAIADTMAPGLQGAGVDRRFQRLDLGTRAPGRALIAALTRTSNTCAV